jgi:methionine-gamma-lyase
MSANLKNRGLSTVNIHAGQHADPHTGAVAPPIVQSSTFAFETCKQGADRFRGDGDGFIYTRMGNPTIARLEEAVTALEGGYGGIATGSGMAALNTILFALLNRGDHLVGTNSVYGPSRMVIEREWSRFGIDSTFVDTSDLQAVRDALRPETRLIFVESPANPTIVLSDIEAVAGVAHDHGAVLVVDNTFASPVLQRPVALGADVVYHSMTKFINGHTDVVAGMIVTSTEERYRTIKQVSNSLGACMDPHQAWLALRGFKTLSLRVKACQENAARVAEFLEAHPKVEWVRYPGLPSHPQHDLARRQMSGFGALLSFEVRGGVEAGARLLDGVELMTLAVSLGGIETLIQHPAGMTHATMPREARIAAGITDGLVRVSVGCEDVEDLLEDFDQALRRV